MSKGPLILPAVVGGVQYTSRAIARWVTFFKALGIDAVVSGHEINLWGTRLFTGESWTMAEEAALKGHKVLYAVGHPVPGGYCLAQVHEFLRLGTCPLCRFESSRGDLELVTISGCLCGRIGAIGTGAVTLDEAYEAVRHMRFSEKILD